MFEPLLIASAVLAGPSADNDRELAVRRPSRSVSAVREAATFPRSMRAWADCVAERESHHNPKARNPASSAQGKFQFLDRLWRTSLAGQVAARLRDHGLPRSAAADVRQYLQRTEIARWPAVYQDIGFIEVNLRGGSYHWRLAGSRCEAYR